MKALNYIALSLVIVGAVNWGLIGFLDFNLVDALFGTGSVLSRIIYAVVGVCGLYALSFFARISVRYLRPMQSIPTDWKPQFGLLPPVEAGIPARQPAPD